MCVGALKTDGTLWAWGNNNYGVLGQNSRTYYSSPRQIPGTKWHNVHVEQLKYVHAIKTYRRINN